jgi:hypothetical protein
MAVNPRQHGHLIQSRTGYDIRLDIGHTDPAFTLRVYAHMMRRSPQEREKLKALVEGHDWTLGEDSGHDSAEQS